MIRDLRRPLAAVSALIVLSLLAMAAYGCSVGDDSGRSGAAAGGKADLVIYSGRKEKLFLPVVREFEKKTGLKVVLKQGKTAELAGTILEENGRPRGDLLLAQEAGVLDKLSNAGVLDPYKPKNFDKIPADFRSADGSWIGVSGRARILMYNTELVNQDDLPKSVFELTDPKWKGKLAMAASTEASVPGWISSLRILKGDKATRDLMAGLIDNDIEVLDNHVLVAKAVGAGEFSIGLVNHYYYHLEKKTGTPVEAIYPDQEEGGVGVLVNTAGISILKGAKHPDAARKFVDFLITPEVQDKFARSNFEYPTLTEVPPFEALPLSDFKRSPLELKQLGTKLDSSLDLLNEFGI